jgi:phosphoribosylaminoimidazole carboxylase PurE protein
MKDVQVLIVMGSESDFETMKACIQVLRDFDVEARVHVASAHRTQDKVFGLVDQAEKAGVQVIIAAAGMAAHLAGCIAGRTITPIIGVPMDSPHMSGLDSLYSMVMMPPGIPVASVGIGKPGAKNAGYLAVHILALGNPTLRKKLADYRMSLIDKVESMDASVQEKVKGM